MGLSRDAQLNIERSVILHLHPKPLSRFGARGVFVGRNLGVVLFTAILIIVLTSLSLKIWA
jgi:hypothetical protein